MHSGACSTNELRNVPLRDLADLGGWKSSQTIAQVYQQPDVDAQRTALAERHQRKNVKAG